jgi:MoaA/NifB/PqqE/SkfB family radical SAM enzyme
MPNAQLNTLLSSALSYKLENMYCRYRGTRAFNSKTGTTGLPGPLTVQIQTIDRCNASCVMCPYTNSNKTGPANRMPVELYAHILHELSALNTVRYLFIMLQNEPLLDPELELKVKQARQALSPKTKLSVVTNGALLSPTRSRALLHSGVDQIAISIDAIEPETFKTIRPGLSFEKVNQNLLSLLNAKPRADVIARYVIQKANRGEREGFQKILADQGSQGHYAKGAKPKRKPG